MRTRQILAAIVAGLLPALVAAQEKMRQPAGPWQELARRCQMDDRTVARLDRDRVVVTGHAYKQVFSPYVSSRIPVFITSDSILNGFHVLFEETLARLETAQADRLQRVVAALGRALSQVDKKVTGDRALIAAAKQRATIVVAVAQALLDKVPPDLPPAVAVVVRDEVKRVQEARERMRPAWLGPPDAWLVAIDYGRCRARGFYTRSETLTRYFRAVAWLQAIPFRIRYDEELLATLMLGSALERVSREPGLQQSGESLKPRRWLEPEGPIGLDDDASRLIEVFRELIGLGDDWDVVQAESFAARCTNERMGFDVSPKSLAAWRKCMVDQAERTGFASLINDQVRLPPEDDRLMKRIGFRVLPAHRTPGGILFARTTDPRDPGLRGRGLPTGLEMGALLGSGYAMAQLDRAPRVQAIIRESSALREGPSILAEYLRCLEALLDAPEPDAPAFMRSEAWQAKQLNTALGGWAQIRHAFVLQAKQSASWLSLGGVPVGFVEPEPEFFARLSRLVRRARFVFDKAGALQPVSCGNEAWFGRKPEFVASLFRAMWEDLETLCQRLETLAHKELRGVPFSQAEEDFLVEYGVRLSRCSFHFGNAYLTPRDDAPRVADVHSDPESDRVLLVGVARPRALWVLYPWQGKEVLCRGAVLPYYELAHSARLTDTAWQALLDGPYRPPSPSWLSPLVGSGGLGKPVLEED
ncbi:MAG: DUF3160 domain-containing protein [Polyangiaceae bacterium]|nr:DUF3160 domain-containing protein [Polyangiaceae bacterium]